VKAPPVINSQDRIDGNSVIPLPAPQHAQQDGVPPVINSQSTVASSILPPPLPAEALQHEMVCGRLSSAVAELEVLRRKAKRDTIAGVLWCVVFVLGLTSLFAGFAFIGNQGGNSEDRGNLAMVVICVCTPICAISLGLSYYFFTSSYRARRRYRRGYKEKIFTAAIRLLNPTFRYQPDGGISLEVFRESRMFLHRIDQYYSEDYVQGIHGATAFEFAEVRASYKVTHLLRRGDDDTYRSLFHGLYFIVDFNKHFTTSALVLPNSGEPLGLMTELLDKLGWKRGKLIQLEDPEFEREFTVHAEDEIEVRYLLTPALMRRILEIKCARGGPMSLSFSREKLHIALNCARDLFEPNPGSSAYSITQIQVFLSQVRSVLSLIDMLNLNTRIWSKRIDGRPSCG